MLSQLGEASYDWFNKDQRYGYPNEGNRQKVSFCIYHRMKKKRRNISYFARAYNYGELCDNARCITLKSKIINYALKGTDNSKMTVKKRFN